MFCRFHQVQPLELRAISRVSVQQSRLWGWSSLGQPDGFRWQGCVLKVYQHFIKHHRSFNAGDDLDSTLAFPALLDINLEYSPHLHRFSNIIATQCYIVVLGSSVERAISGMTVSAGIVAVQGFWLNGGSGSFFVFKSFLI